MNWFEKIKYYYDSKLWDKERVARAVELGKITQEEYNKIVSEETTETKTKATTKK